MEKVRSCRQCGTCCRAGGPALHIEDMPLLKEGVLQLNDLCTFRAGELVRDTSDGLIVPLPAEIVKIAPSSGARPDDWACRFLTGDNRCFIHGSKPAECQALFCEDPSALLSMQDHERLDRLGILQGLDAPAWLAESVESHESRCSYARLAELAENMDSDGEARRAFLETVEYDRQFRGLVAEKGRVRPEMLDFLFGRPLLKTIIMFGIDARRNADGSTTLVQMATMPHSGGRA
ncbi:MAG: YkgJ family cysteine cluster protein [Mailhella sp.]|nr:YkgJ family cysteine cluster protein [Mailhella sp.]